MDCKKCADFYNAGSNACIHPRYNTARICPLPKVPLRLDGVGELPPGSVIHAPKGKDLQTFGMEIAQTNNSVKHSRQAVWDEYFMTMCEVVATNVKCYSRQIGAVIVIDKAIISTGYNGPPRGIPQCYEKLNLERGLEQLEEPCCPRQKLGADSGTMLELCYAQHAERNAITQAARNGTSIKGATLYLNDTIPCKDCLGAIINAGIAEVVCTKLEYYDANNQGEWLVNNADLIVRVPYAKADANPKSVINSEFVNGDRTEGGEDGS